MIFNTLSSMTNKQHRLKANHLVERAFIILCWCFCILLSAICIYRIFTEGYAAFPSMEQHFDRGLLLGSHVVGASVAIFLVPFQFFKGLRINHPGLHRWSGRFYIASLLVGSTSGALMAPYADGGVIAASGFLVLAALSLVSTLWALYMALNGNFLRHRNWMLRSAALLFSGVTLRAYLGVSGMLDLPHETAYILVAWISWLPNLIVVELCLRCSKGP